MSATPCRICRRCESAYSPERARASIEATNVSEASKASALADLARGYCPICHLSRVVHAVRAAAVHHGPHMGFAQ